MRNENSEPLRDQANCNTNCNSTTRNLPCARIRSEHFHHSPTFVLRKTVLSKLQLSLGMFQWALALGGTPLRWGGKLKPDETPTRNDITLSHPLTRPARNAPILSGILVNNWRNVWCVGNKGIRPCRAAKETFDFRRTTQRLT